MDIKTLITVPIAVGELIDKITILEVKVKRLNNPEQVEAARTELLTLRKIKDENLAPSAELISLHDHLKTTNDFLWDLEDEIRRSLNGVGGSHSRAIGLIAAIHRKNDERARFKKQLNELYNSQIVEVKKYAHQDEV